MAEYWHIKPGFEERVKSFFNNCCEPSMVMEYTLGEKDFVNAGNASAEIKVVLKRLAVDPVILRRVAIASYEAEINETAHAKGGLIKCRIFEDCVHIQFDDNGPGMADIEQAMIPGWSTADDYVREMGFGAGLGLPNIKNNSDAMHIVSQENDKSLVEIVIYFQPES